ncbi:hypothetical protein QUV83_04565 [Cellulomonas cellasea]|uniref:hypothetical protein n=1 Tax=Cellulomonas cellasea TaxID=43670 RepID=UPI0025A32D6F|nr:hypothetical protein [Cellulomonas cellasea]MDM8084035.1 hypothetical protein [Cellulomonas cellasea]
MSTTDSSHASPHGHTALAARLAAVLVTAAALIATLERWGPGNLGRGVAVGCLIGAALGGVALWRGTGRPDSATPGDRLCAGSGDERDHAIATRAFAVVGVSALPLTSAATLAISLGAPVAPSLFFLVVAQLAFGYGAFALVTRSA